MSRSRSLLCSTLKWHVVCHRETMGTWKLDHSLAHKNVSGVLVTMQDSYCTWIESWVDELYLFFFIPLALLYKAKKPSPFFSLHLSVDSIVILTEFISSIRCLLVKRSKKANIGDSLSRLRNSAVNQNVEVVTKYLNSTVHVLKLGLNKSKHNPSINYQKLPEEASWILY